MGVTRPGSGGWPRVLVAVLALRGCEPSAVGHLLLGRVGLALLRLLGLAQVLRDGASAAHHRRAARLLLSHPRLSAQLERQRLPRRTHDKVAGSIDLI